MAVDGYHGDGIVTMSRKVRFAVVGTVPSCIRLQTYIWLGAVWSTAVRGIWLYVPPKIRLAQATPPEPGGRFSGFTESGVCVHATVVRGHIV